MHDHHHLQSGPVRTKQVEQARVEPGGLPSSALLFEAWPVGLHGEASSAAAARACERVAAPPDLGVDGDGTEEAEELLADRAGK